MEAHPGVCGSKIADLDPAVTNDGTRRDATRQGYDPRLLRSEGCRVVSVEVVAGLAPAAASLNAGPEPTGLGIHIDGAIGITVTAINAAAAASRRGRVAPIIIAAARVVAASGGGVRVLFASPVIGDASG